MIIIIIIFIIIALPSVRKFLLIFFSVLLLLLCIVLCVNLTGSSQLKMYATPFTLPLVDILNNKLIIMKKKHTKKYTLYVR